MSVKELSGAPEEPQGENGGDCGSDDEAQPGRQEEESGGLRTDPKLSLNLSDGQNTERASKFSAGSGLEALGPPMM